MRDFIEVLDSLSDMEMALSMYYAAGSAITKGKSTIPSLLGNITLLSISMEDSHIRHMLLVNRRSFLGLVCPAVVEHWTAVGVVSQLLGNKGVSKKRVSP